jgi:hypothetical protein
VAAWQHQRKFSTVHHDLEQTERTGGRRAGICREHVRRHLDLPGRVLFEPSHEARPIPLVLVAHVSRSSVSAIKCMSTLIVQGRL